MGKELPLARSEEEGRSVLLASTRIGELIHQSSNRDKREKAASTTKGKAGRKAKDTSSASKGSPKAKRANVSARPERYGRDNKDRKSGRGDERATSRPRRTAQELGIEFPGSCCDEALTSPHSWSEVDKVDKGSLMKCSKCLRHLWLPLSSNEAEKLGSLMREHRSTLGYQKYLNYHRPVKVLVAKLQDLRSLSFKIKDEAKFTKLVVAVMNNKDYDRREK